VTSQALDRLASYSWPGNVRELRNTVAHMAAMAEGDALDSQHLPASLPRTEAAASPRASGSAPGGLRPGESLADRLLAVEAGLYRWALSEEGGNQSAAARRLGVTETMVRNRMRKLGIRRLFEGASGNHPQQGEGR
jgi:DNA-binding NtrC family response regulator